MKHNKKRNTAFLYEVLVREGTKATLAKDLDRVKTVKDLILEFFNNSSWLGAELYLYGCLKKPDVDRSLADKYLAEVKYRHAGLDKRELFNEQTRLINKINKQLGSEVYENFIPYYKDLATIAQIFNDAAPVKDKLLLEQEVLSRFESKAEQQLKPIDNIVYKTFVKKFNDKYSALLSEQKDLLSRYISSFADDGMELKVYLNEQLGVLNERVKKALDQADIKSDAHMTEKTNKILDLLKQFKTNKSVTPDMMENLLKIQQFVHEVEKND